MVVIGVEEMAVDPTAEFSENMHQLEALEERVREQTFYAAS